MSESDHKKITAALFLALRPIAKMLLRFGIGYSEFSNISKSVFIKVASEEFGVRGRPTNISRIAAMNGLSRKEVGRLKDVDTDSLSDLSKHQAPLYVLLHVWETDQKYLSANGIPLILPFTGDGVSFSSLVEECVGDIPPGAVRTELKRVGAVSELSDKSLQLEDVCFEPTDKSERMVIGLSSLYALADTVEFNSGSEISEPTRLQRLAVIDNFPSSKLDDAKKLAEEKLKKASVEIDEYLTGQAESNPDPNSKIRVGVGLYYYEMPDVDEYW